MKKLFLSFVMLLATTVSALALPTTDVELVIGEHGSTTFICPFGFEVPSEIHAYLFQGWDEERKAPILEEVFNIEANTPYFVVSDNRGEYSERFTGVSEAEAASYSYYFDDGEGLDAMCTGVYAELEITAGWVLREVDGQWGFSMVRADEPFTVPANQVYFYRGPKDGFAPDPAESEPAKWTDSEGNEVTQLKSTKPYYSYLNVFPTITLHLEGAVNQGDGEYEFDWTNGIIAEGTTYTVTNGQVNQDVTFTLKPVNGELFKFSALPMIEYSYSQTSLRDDEESAFMPLWDETEWAWDYGDLYNYDMKLDNTTTPAAGEEYVLAKISEMPIEEGGAFNARALKVITKKPCAKGDNGHYMEASKITFENRAAGKMTIEFSAVESLDVPMYINVDGHKYTSVEESPLGNIEYRQTTDDYDTQNGSMNESDKKTITFYVNPGVHTISGRYSGNMNLVYLDEYGDLDEENPWVAYFFPDEAAMSSFNPEQAILYMDLDEYYAAQNIRVYSMHFEPIVHEVTINGQYGWASLFHEHDLIVPEYADFEFYYAPTYDGTNVELLQYQPLSQADYNGQVIQDSAALVLRGSEGIYTFYGATVGDPEKLRKAGEWVAGPKDAQPEYAHFETANIFKGVIEDTPCASEQYYVMGRETTYEGAIFQKYSGTTLGAHKVYLDLNGANASVRLVLPGNNPIVTGVEELNAAKASKALKDGKIVIRRGNKIYDVNGQML